MLYSQQYRRDNKNFALEQNLLWTIWFNIEEKIKFLPRFCIGINRHNFDFCRLLLLESIPEIFLLNFICYMYFLIQIVPLLKNTFKKARKVRDVSVVLGKNNSKHILVQNSSILKLEVINFIFLREEYCGKIQHWKFVLYFFWGRMGNIIIGIT